MSQTNSPYGFLNLLKFAYVNNKNCAVTQEQLKPYLNRYTSLRTVAKSDYLVHFSQTLQAINLVVSGEFYITRSSSSGFTNMIARCKAPEFIGMTQIISGDPLFYSNIIACEKCLVIDIDCDYFRKCLYESGEAAMIIMSSLTTIIERNHARMEQMAFHDSTDNLIGYIYRKWLEGGSRQDTIYVREKHTLIATDLGSTVRTVCRAINKLKEQDLISTAKGGVLVISPEQMRRIKQLYDRQ